VAPSDVEHPNYPAYIRNFAPLPLQPLPFPSVVVVSDNDHVVSLQRAAHFASCWGSSLQVVRQAGHFLPKDGFGPWPEGLTFLESF
jgi:predicted alpha/beta hydrolase family esterase